MGEMSSKFLIYIGEDQKFDMEDTVSAISAIPGVSNPRRGEFIGAVFECEYEDIGISTIVRISPDAETVTVEGFGDEAIKFMLELQSRLRVDLHVIDLEYSFDLSVRQFSTVEEFKRAAGME
jgi:hypothetical protein